MLDPRNCIVSVKRQPYKESNKSRLSYVKIEHVPSGIVTTAIGLSQPETKNRCLLELEQLVYIWEKN